MNVNIDLTEMSEYCLGLLHEFLVEAFGLTGKYYQELADVEHELWWREHEMDNKPDE